MTRHFLAVLLVTMFVSIAEAEVQNVKVSGDVDSAEVYREDYSAGGEGVTNLGWTNVTEDIDAGKEELDGLNWTFSDQPINEAYIHEISVEGDIDDKLKYAPMDSVDQKSEEILDVEIWTNMPDELRRDAVRDVIQQVEEDGVTIEKPLELYIETIDNFYKSQDAFEVPLRELIEVIAISYNDFKQEK